MPTCDPYLTDPAVGLPAEIDRATAAACGLLDAGRPELDAVMAVGRIDGQWTFADTRDTARLATMEAPHILVSAEGLAQSPAVLREAIERAGIAGAPHGADAWQYRIGEAAIYIHPCHVDITQYPDLARVRGDLSLSEAIQYARELAPEYDAVTCVVSIDGVRWRVVYDDDPAAQAPDITHRWRCDGDGVVLELGTMAELPPQMTATSITLAHAKNGVSTIRVDGVVIDVCQEAGRSSPEAVRELAAWLAQALAERGQG